MKNATTLVNVILALAVAALFYLHFSDNKETPGETNEEIPAEKAKLKLAYVNVDSLLLNYSFSKDLNEQLLKQQEDSRTDFTEKARVLERQTMDFQRKLENNGFLTRERAEEEQKRLLKKRQNLAELDRKLSGELMEAQQKMNIQLRDTITNFLKEYNQVQDYELVLSNTLGGNVLFSKDGYDITSDVVRLLNQRYQASNK